MYLTFDGVPATQWTWHVGEVTPPGVQECRVLTIQADGDELELLRQRMFQLPEPAKTQVSGNTPIPVSSHVTAFGEPSPVVTGWCNCTGSVHMLGAPVCKHVPKPTTEDEFMAVVRAINSLLRALVIGTYSGTSYQLFQEIKRMYPEMPDSTITIVIALALATR